MINIVYFIPIHTIIMVLVSSEEAIVEFNANSASDIKGVKVPQYDEHVKTRDFSFCLRFMTQFNPNYFLINTNQVSFWLNQNHGYLYQKSLNATSRSDEYCRMFKFCKTYIPGNWMSICLSIKLNGMSQKITFFQDGKICSRVEYLDGDFEWLFWNPSNRLEEV